MEQCKTLTFEVSLCSGYPPGFLEAHNGLLKLSQLEKFQAKLHMDTHSGSIFRI